MVSARLWKSTKHVIVIYSYVSQKPPTYLVTVKVIELFEYCWLLQQIFAQQPDNIIFEAGICQDL